MIHDVDLMIRIKMDLNDLGFIFELGLIRIIRSRSTRACFGATVRFLYCDLDVIGS